MTKKVRVPKGPPAAYANRGHQRPATARFMLAAGDDPFTMLGMAHNIYYALDGAWALHKKHKKPILVYDTSLEGPDPIAVIQILWVDRTPKEETDDVESPEAEVEEDGSVRPEEQEEGPDS